MKQRVKDAPYDEAYPREMVEQAYRANVDLGDAVHSSRLFEEWRLLEVGALVQLEVSKAT